MMSYGKIIAATARAALTDDAFEREPSYCQRFARQVVAKATGNKFAKYAKGTADASAKAWRTSSFVVPKESKVVAGDLLYWFGTPRQTAGHVAIAISASVCAQNSITDKWDKATGNKGTRALSTMRPPDLIVRL